MIDFGKWIVPSRVLALLDSDKRISVAETRNDLLELAMGGSTDGCYEVGYDVDGVGYMQEATVTQCKNGIVINYVEEYMRRRDPNCLLVADEKETDKKRYEDEFGERFDSLRDATFAWLDTQDLIVMPFMAGDSEIGYPALMIGPKNAGFFAAALSDLQGFIPVSELPEDYEPQAVIFVAPPFRHTHFGGRQIVVHNRRGDVHELFSYNLYPGPSAKKGVYGVLIEVGEKEDWVTAHASSVQVITPYDNIITFMHEGASGGGKSEMIEPIHKEPDGHVLIGENIVTKAKDYLMIKETCTLRPVTDDMALCHPDIQTNSGKLVIKDAEDGWFLRMNHLDKYGTSPMYEELCIHPKEPLVFFNVQGVPDSTCLIWEHTMDAPGKPCPNPRVIMPRKHVPSVINDSVEIDVRSFGVRTPPCTKEAPSIGIMGMLHILPPGLAWLWRLVAPRGFDNPSIVGSKGMSSEGVGSYWPFATGKMATQANLLLKQFVTAKNTRYILIPNQHIGAYKVGFMPQWITREYMARRGSAKFMPDQLIESKCHLLGFALESMKVDGTYISKSLLQTNRQQEVGEEGYEQGAAQLYEFFKKELAMYSRDELDQLGRQLIECCFDNGTMDDYSALIPVRL